MPGSPPSDSGRTSPALTAASNRTRLIRDYAEGQLILIEVGRASLGGEVADEEAIAEGNRLRGEFVESLHVEIDPRYGRFEEGTFQRGGTSLSVPASAEALAGSQAQPGDAFVAALPASQQCR